MQVQARSSWDAGPPELMDQLTTTALPARRDGDPHRSVLLGEGRRLFDHLGTDHVDLEPTRVIDAPGVTHQHHRVHRTS